LLKLKTSHPYSFYAFLAIIVYFIVSFTVVQGWKAKKIISADRANYYVYLPATFIYGDLHFNYADSLNSELGARSVTYFINEEGRRCQKMPVGVSIMEAPFFLLGHAWAKLDDHYVSNGYSEIYFFFIVMSALFYALMSVFFIRKILLRYCPDKVSAIVILLIAAGTNVLYYATYIGGISHLPGLFLVSAFMWYSIHWIDTKKRSSFALAMLSLGMAIIVRPSNALFGLFLVIYIAESNWSFKGVFSHVGKNITAYLFSILLFLIPIFIQLSLWKYMSGDWVQYSYRDEGFFFGDPEIIKGLFSARNSMIPYAPFLLFAFMGVFIPVKKPFPRYSLIVVLVLFIYVIYSWWCWWYGGSVGSRAAIESYAILALLLAYFIQFIGKRLPKKAVYALLIIALPFSFYFARLKADQYSKVIMHWDSMTFPAYWDIFLDSHRPDDFNDHLENPDYDNAKYLGLEYPHFKKMTPESPYSDTLTIDLKDIDWSEQDSIEVNYTLWAKYKFSKDSFVKLVADIPGTGYQESININPKIKNKGWNRGTITVHIPEKERKQKVLIYYHYRGDFRCFYEPANLAKE
jgi:hypothetical protein